MFSNNKKMVLWGWVCVFPTRGRREEKKKKKIFMHISWFRWGNSQHHTNLPLEQKCQEGLWKCTDGSNYIDNLPFPEAEKSILHWQNSDKFLWKSERNQYSLCGRNSCEGLSCFSWFSPLFFLLLPPNSTVENAVNERSKSNIRSQMSLDM